MSAYERWVARLRAGTLGEVEGDPTTWVTDDLYRQALAEEYPEGGGRSRPTPPRRQDPPDVPPPESGARRRVPEERGDASEPPEPAGTFKQETLALAEDLVGRKRLPVDAVASGLPSWDSACGGAGGRTGIARGWYVIIGAATGQGKTLAACNLVAAALRLGERVCFVSLEMDADELYTRIDAIWTGQDVHLLEQGATFDYDRAIAARAVRLKQMEAVRSALFVNQEPVETLDEIDYAIQYHHRVHGCRYFVIDYLQLAWVEGTAANVLAQVTEVSHRVRKLTRKLRLITVGLSQLNRESSKDYENPPTAQSLFGGSPLENDAHQVILLDHTTYERTADGRGAKTRLLLDKNRHGPRKKFDVEWDYRTMQLYEPEWVPPALRTEEQKDFKEKAAGQDELPLT